jgi:alpha-amylase/alpha-mannosidase (GH57 family)
MIYWAQLLHFYQPPTQVPSMLKRICKESYYPLIDLFKEYPYAKATVNFNGVLTEMLMDCGHEDIVSGYRTLSQKGQIEFTGSGKYHPILPLIPKYEMERQIRLNKSTNRRFFGETYNPKGFFPPEMCYSKDILPPIIQAGYRWIILGGIACPADWPMDTIYKAEYEGESISVLFRDDVLSNKISFQDMEAAEFITHLEQWKGNREHIYVVTAMDAETFGHHIQGWEKMFLAKVYDELDPDTENMKDLKQTKILANQHAALLGSKEASTQIQMVTISELLDLFPAGKVIKPKASSWSTTADDIAHDNPYPLWHDKDNKIHRLQWEHLDICIKLVNKAIECADNDENRQSAEIARRLLDRAEHSCQMWWASKRPMWDINLIHMGMLDQNRVVVNAFRTINKSGVDEKTRREYYYLTVAARDIRNKLDDRLFIQ